LNPLSADYPVTPTRGGASRRAPAQRRWLLCAVTLVLLLAHQALVARDHHGGGDRAEAMTGPAVVGSLVVPDDATPPADSPDAPATLRGACPAHQGTLPLPPTGGDPPLAAGGVAAPSATPLRIWAPPLLAGDPQRRRALLQVFRN